MAVAPLNRMDAKGIDPEAVPSASMKRIVATAAILLSAAACGGNASPATTSLAPQTTTAPDPTTTGASTTTLVTTTTMPLIPSTGEARPPADYEALAAVFDPVVASLGYRIGRAALIDRGTYRETPDGDHLALYLTPLFDKSPDEYVTDFLALARILGPGVFAAWPGLNSFDVCQEPFAWEGATSPPGLTILDVFRDAAAQIDWATVDLAGLLTSAQALDGLDIHAQQEIRTTDAWSAAAGG